LRTKHSTAFRGKRSRRLPESRARGLMFMRI